MTKVLIVDDEADIVAALKIYLSSQPYEILTAYNGKEAVECVKNDNVDLVLMDIMMPVMDGIAALSKIREFSNVPVIMLSAKSDDTDKVLGLDVGADDYITKPFNPSEVMARIRSALRRYQKLGGEAVKINQYVVGSIVLNDDTKEVFVDGDQVILTPSEYGILKMLMKNPGTVYKSGEIYEEVWKDQPIGSESTIAVHIRHLREKIEIDPSDPRYVKVVWGQGYKMEKHK